MIYDESTLFKTFETSEEKVNILFINTTKMKKMTEVHIKHLSQTVQNIIM